MENSTVNYIDIGKKILQLRKGKKMTQKQLAEMTGVSMSYMGLIERGERKASLETIVSIANALGVGLNYLLSASLHNVTGELTPEVSLSQRSALHRLLSEFEQTLDGWSGEEEV